MVRVKICGLMSRAAIDAARDAGADEIGIVIDPKSPRCVNVPFALELAHHAAALGAPAWLVRTSDRGEGGAQPAWLAEVQAGLGEGASGLIGVQLHPRPSDWPQDFWTAAFGQSHPLSVAIPVSARADLAAAASHASAHRLVLDAKPPPGAAYAGGHGRAFDWTVVHGWAPRQPWMLAGGLTPANVAEAVHVTGASLVDVSSGVETQPGTKDPALMRAFVSAAKHAGSHAQGNG